MLIFEKGDLCQKHFRVSFKKLYYPHSSHVWDPDSHFIRWDSFLLVTVDSAGSLLPKQAKPVESFFPLSLGILELR